MEIVALSGIAILAAILAVMLKKVQPGILDSYQSGRWGSFALDDTFQDFSRDQPNSGIDICCGH